MKAISLLAGTLALLPLAAFAQSPLANLDLVPDTARVAPAPAPVQAGKWHDPLTPPASATSAANAEVRALDMGEIEAHMKQAPNNLSPTIKSAVEASHQKLLDALDAQRTRAYKELGINPESDGRLLIMVSSSMPQGMLSGYGESAMWTGAALVFRGVDPKHTIPWFITHVMHSLVRKKGASPTITLDPRVFRAYGVDTVPTIVYTTVQPDNLCMSTVKVPVDVGAGKPPASFHGCGPASPAKYWKITGAVSVAYALRQFVAAGAPGADRLLKAMQSSPYFSAGKAPVEVSAQDYKKVVAPVDFTSVLKMLGGSQNPWADYRGFEYPPLPPPPGVKAPVIPQEGISLDQYRKEQARKRAKKKDTP